MVPLHLNLAASQLELNEDNYALKNCLRVRRRPLIAYDPDFTTLRPPAACEEADSPWMGLGLGAKSELCPWRKLSVIGVAGLATR